jgi:tetrahydromethanopterin S-methyltransferase subunit E
MWLRLRMLMLQSMRLGRVKSATRSMAKYFITAAHYPSARYDFSGYGGVNNCSKCDIFHHTNEYVRDDGLVVWFCTKCEDQLEL